MKYKFTIMLKDGIKDNQGGAIETCLQSMGFDQVKGVRMGKAIIVEVSDDTDLEKLTDFLVNPVMEQYTVEEVAGE